MNPRIFDRLSGRTTGVVVAAVLVVVGFAGPRADPTTVEASGGSDLGAGGEFHSIDPARILDTRLGDDRPRMSPAGSAFNVGIVGRGGLPAFEDLDEDLFDDRVLAVAVSITVVGPSDDGFLAAHPAGSSRSDSSLVNFLAGDDVPNSAILRPGVAGELTVTLTSPRSQRGSADVIIDVFGWFSSSMHDERGARLVPVNPYRVVDTRLTAQPLGPNGFLRVPIAGVGGVPAGDEVVGVVANLTAVNNRVDSRDTFLSVVPSVTGSGPTTSNLNLRSGSIRPVTVIVPIGDDGSIIIHNNSGRVDVLVDVMGYFGMGADVSTRRGRVVPLVSPVRIIDTRLPAFGAQPLAPGAVVEWSMDDFVDRVTVDDAWIGPQSAVIGTLTAARLRQDEAISTEWSFVSVGPAGADAPDASILNLVANRDVANLAVMGFGSSTNADNGLVLRNAFGFVDLILDASAVVLNEWPMPEPVDSSTTSTTVTPTSTTSTSTTSTSTTSTTVTSTSTTSTTVVSVPST